MHADVLEPHRRHLWGLCYRLTGSAAEADDLVQDTFERALTRSPDASRDLRPWLTKVALNLGRDALRRRRERPYPGPWLPSPIAAAEAPLVPAALDPSGRYDLMESVTLGFLVALEALSPKQRAVLLLRDVFDYSGAETSEMLDLSASDVKVSLHRARKRMASYDAQRTAPCVALSERTENTVAQLVMALSQGNHSATQALLAKEARAFTDSGGEFIAARRIVTGAQDVARFLEGLLRKRPPEDIQPLTVNGAPAMHLRYPPRGPRDAPRAVIQAELNRGGVIANLYAITASSKLTHLPE